MREIETIQDNILGAVGNYYIERNKTSRDRLFALQREFVDTKNAISDHLEAIADAARQT